MNPGLSDLKSHMLVSVALVTKLRFVDQTSLRHQIKNEEFSMSELLWIKLMGQDKVTVAGHHDHLHDDF